MNEPAELIAWLETADGEKLPLDGVASLGRSSVKNRYVFPGNKVSSRHALIHTQEGGEFWLLDLGSTNGTLLNGEHLPGPARLRDGDRINLGHAVELVFRQPVSAEDLRSFSTLAKTATHTYEEQRWLLIADLEGFSEMGKTVDAPMLARTVGKWLSAASDLLEGHGGRVNKFTGDGFLGFWRADAEAPAEVAAALTAFGKLPAPEGMRFRVVVHLGTVAIGGAPSLGEESLLSDDLSFTFRLEKVAANMAVQVLLSAAAAKALHGLLPLQERAYGEEIKGFPGPHAFYVLAPVC